MELLTSWSSDRFNGYTWQTRTLEVRPDRLPPEYEPQPHANHHVAPPRPPLYTYHNMSGGGSSAFSLPGHLTPSNGPAWLPGQMPSQRPPMNFPPGAPGSQQMSSVNSLPGVGLSPHPPLMALEGTSPIPSSQSPISLHGNADIPLPLSGQNIGNHVYQHLGASPLAGSLTAGTVPAPLNSFSTSSRRESITPFAHSVTSDANGSLPRGSVSPNGDVGLSTSRPTSSTGRLPRSHSPANGTSDFEHQAPPRVGPPGHLASLFGSVESAISPTESGLHPSQSAPNNHPGPSFSIGAQQALPVPMEGLAHQASGLGPPTTLHDRVVFVSNVRLKLFDQNGADGVSSCP